MNVPPAIHQMNLSATCICLEVVTVEVSVPPPPLPGGAASDAPVLSKTAALSTGGEKFGWLKTLKNSTRNCALKFSDILLKCMFLNRDTSKWISPGPVSWLRPAFPRRFAQEVCVGSAGKGWHTPGASPGGCCGSPKHSSFM